LDLAILAESDVSKDPHTSSSGFNLPHRAIIIIQTGFPKTGNYPVAPPPHVPYLSAIESSLMVYRKKPKSVLSTWIAVDGQASRCK